MAPQRPGLLWPAALAFAAAHTASALPIAIASVRWWRRVQWPKWRAKSIVGVDRILQHVDRCATIWRREEVLRRAYCKVTGRRKACSSCVTCGIRRTCPFNTFHVLHHKPRRPRESWISLRGAGSRLAAVSFTIEGSFRFSDETKHNVEILGIPVPVTMKLTPSGNASQALAY